MTIDVSFVPEVTDPAALESLFVDYYKAVLVSFEKAGGPVLSPQELARDSMAHLDDMLPPDGRLALATAQDGRLVGCGAFRKIRPDAVEMKRMFVRPEYQGHGLGRRLFELRIEEARRMGCSAVYADTAKGNRSMLSMYERFGFQYIPRYPENANPPEFEPFLVFLELKLSEAPTG